MRSGEMVRWEFLEVQLLALERSDALRKPDDGDVRRNCELAAGAIGATMLDASSNDYLAYTQTVSRETSALDPGAGASRLIHGTRPIHRDLEHELSDWMRREATLLFSSGYAANLGVLSSVPQAGDLIVSDALNHASIIDGCRLSRAETKVVPHLDIAAIREHLIRESPKRRCWVVTESYFSMDGDSPNLAALRDLCNSYGARLVVDEAHALGVFGAEGAGLCRQSDVVPDILIGTFGKAIGGQGAFVTSEAPLRCWLWNKARSFVYSTATSPILCEHILRNIKRARADDPARQRLAVISTRVRERLRCAGVPILAGSHGPIVPVILGDAKRALCAADRVRDMGVLVQAIRPPSVESGASRIRLTLKAALTDDDVNRIIQAVIQACA